MKIKIIDLLNKIANEGKTPKHIKCNNLNLYWNDENYTYDIREDKLYVPFYIFDYSELNDEIEIIEESKKIEKMECSVESWFSPSQADIEIINKINELIDEINNLREK